MSEATSQLLDRLKQKKEPAVKKPVSIKYAKSKEEVTITTKISDKRPVANINRESILQILLIWISKKPQIFRAIFYHLFYEQGNFLF